MPWYVEQGIGENRAILVVGAEIIAAQIEWPGTLIAGEVRDAVLISRPKGNTRGIVRFPSGEEALADRLPANASEGSTLRMLVTRASIAEKGRLKRAQARPSEKPAGPPPSLADRLRASGANVQVVHAFPVEGWEDILTDAWEGSVTFPDGGITISTTPAMTVIDVDGYKPPKELAIAAVPAIAGAIRRFDLGGSIGIDFPTLPSKDDRRAVDAEVERTLGDWPHERTAINGFGLMHIVSRLERPSLLHRIASDPAGVAARSLLRQAERVAGPGKLLLTAHPRVRAAVSHEWEGELIRRTGRQLQWREDSALALQAGFAQAIAL